jgi:hypothetical protein
MKRDIGDVETQRLTYLPLGSCPETGIMSDIDMEKFGCHVRWT